MHWAFGKIFKNMLHILFSKKIQILIYVITNKSFSNNVKFKKYVLISKLQISNATKYVMFRIVVNTFWLILTHFNSIWLNFHILGMWLSDIAQLVMIPDPWWPAPTWTTRTPSWWTFSRSWLDSMDSSEKIRPVMIRIPVQMRIWKIWRLVTSMRTRRMKTSSIRPFQDLNLSSDLEKYENKVKDFWY